jgi:HemY protein
MIRIVSFLLVIAIGAFAAGWFIDREGSVEIVWLEHHVSTSVAVLVGGVALLTALLIAVWWLTVVTLNSPARMAQKAKARRARKAHHAMTQGLIAVGAGDVATAARYAGEARKLAAHEPLTLLLSAQSAQLSGDRAAAEKMFTAMTGRPDTKLLGLHGLFVEAHRRNDLPAARALAEQAVKTAPAPHWAGRAVLEFRCASGDWSGALETLDGNYRSGILDRVFYRRQRAVLLTARARSLVDQDRDSAKAAVFEAVKLAPDLVPAAALAGRFYIDAGDTRRASRVIESAWRVNPHPDLAEVYVNLKPGDSARERLVRAEKLAGMAPGNVEAALALARAAIDAQSYAAARTTLAPLLVAPTQRVAVLMAELEEAGSGNVGRARAWMARALRAMRDPAWTADGFVSDVWLPVSPATGRIDAFEWKVPVADLQGPMIEADDGVTELEALAPPETATAQPADVAVSEPDQADAKPAEAPRAPAADRSSVNKTSTAAVTQPPEPVIPLIHAPDDPGPDAPDDPAPIAAPRGDGRGKFRTLFK